MVELEEETLCGLESRLLPDTFEGVMNARVHTQLSCASQVPSRKNDFTRLE